MIRWQSEVKQSDIITIMAITNLIITIMISILIDIIITMTTMHRDVTFAGCHGGPASYDAHGQTVIISAQIALHISSQYKYTWKWKYKYTCEV